MDIYSRIRGDPEGLRANETIAQYLSKLSASEKAQAIASIRQVRATQGVEGAVLQQTMAALRQTMTLDFGMANIAMEMNDTDNVLRLIAVDLHKVGKPSVFGQIVGAGGLFLGSAAVAYMKRLAEQAENIASSLGRIADNVYSENSRGDKFPGHVHSFVRSMIEKHQTDTVPHYFFVSNQSTT